MRGELPRIFCAADMLCEWMRLRRESPRGLKSAPEINHGAFIGTTKAVP